MGFAQQNQAYEAQQETYKNNRDASNKAAAQTYASIQNRQLQDDAASGQELQKLNIEGMKGRATASVAAGEAGVTGLSVDGLIADYYGQQGRYERTLSNNAQMNASALRGEMDSTRATAEGRINSVDQGQKPSFADAAIRILGAGVDAYSTYKSKG
ncbi:hypothetical protein [Mesorhizobium sp. M7A.F.Ca.CA.004.02.1.1]|uniref:virion core protein, T7 gp14 family n=1 Tax=Mesorhizobium sp. M7A.F.Ca.CA.004.02.1.1 TaxID=2496690 RepID=UPI000FCAB7F8|nr:hypothetical protein [Mesorhizobium sp. M7A.F.Ca.CA.004.02.1.1]RVB05688.1 hypothetical protein EN912_02175 [Mesorhizobium sp. M7A.F.Ca.CA.004.02.1.1]